MYRGEVGLVEGVGVGAQLQQPPHLSIQPTPVFLLLSTAASQRLWRGHSGRPGGGACPRPSSLPSRLKHFNVEPWRETRGKANGMAKERRDLLEFEY